MISFMLSLLQESPLLFAVMVINLIIVAYIIIRIAMYVAYKKKPGKIVSHFFWKMKARQEKEEIKSIEQVYAFIMESLRKEGVLGKQDKLGVLARKKVLSAVPAGDKLNILQQLFGLYESKVYGNRRISNESNIVADILNRYANM
jgi:hypothetical protein